MTAERYIAIIANMTNSTALTATLRSIRAQLNLTQEQLAERLGVSFASVNRWEGGSSTPQKAAREVIAALAAEAGLDGVDDSAPEAPAAAAEVTRRRRGKAPATVPTTKPMEQMLWDAACSIRGEKDAAKFKDYLLPLLFLKRLSDVFDDEIDRLAEEYGDRETALEIAEGDHSLLRFYLSAEARWAVIAGREAFDWPLDAKGNNTAPRDIGEHLTKAVRAVVKQNPSLSGVLDVVDFAAERNGERDINPAKLRGVVETFSDPRYRLGLADVQPDFLGRAYEYLLRKFAEGSGQSAGEFFTPTEVGFLMAHIMRPKPGEDCHDYACGSAGLLVKLQLVARELDPTSKVPLKLTGQELQAESYAVAKMNGIIHDMQIELARGDTMINPKFRTTDGKIKTHDVVVANPMWNQPFAPDVFANDPFDRFRTTGGITTGKGDWAWLQHTLACLNDNGRAAVVLDTGVMARGSGSKNEDKERNIRKWFIDRDLIDGVILLPENLFYNTTAAGVIIVLNRRKPTSRKGRIVLFNASRRFTKGKPKNYLASDDIEKLAAQFLKGESIAGELLVITKEQAVEADYNLSPSRWVAQAADSVSEPIDDLIVKAKTLADEGRAIEQRLFGLRVEGDGGYNAGAFPMRSLGDLIGDGIIEAVNGFAFGGHNDGDIGTPHIRPFNVRTDGEISLEQIKSIPDDAAKGRPRLQRNDVVFNNTNTKELVGKCALWDLDITPVFSNHMTRIRVLKRDTCDPIFLNYAILQHWVSGKSEMLARAHVAQASIMGERFREIVVMWPSIEEQRRIADMIVRVRDTRRSHARQEQMLKAIFSGLLSKILLTVEPEVPANKQVDAS